MQKLKKQEYVVNLDEWLPLFKTYNLNSILVILNFIIMLIFE